MFDILHMHAPVSIESRSLLKIRLCGVRSVAYIMEYRSVRSHPQLYCSRMAYFTYSSLLWLFLTTLVD